MRYLFFFFFLFSINGQEFDRREWRVWKNFRGCLSVREKILIDYSIIPVKMDANNCNIISGEWKSIWENKTYYLPREIDIDHTVPLAWAWRHGANTWLQIQKENYANNFREKYYLLPLSASANRAKGDRGPDEWLPEINRCFYIITFQNIVKQNKLILSEIEKNKYEQIKKRECDETL